MARLFDDRERAAEWAFAHEEEARFIMHCSALKSLGEESAARMNLDEAASEAYAKGLVTTAIDGAKDDAVIERVRVDLEAHGISETAAGLNQRLAQHLAAAVLRSRPE